VACDDGVDGHYSLGYLSWADETWTDAARHWAVAS
jgi:hypothetical protein